MATLITKNSSTAAAVPGAGDIVQGELAVNVADKRLFTKDAGGTVVEVGTNPSSLVVAGNAQTTPISVTFSATAMIIDCSLSNVFRTTFTANVTTAPTISNPKNGQTINWFITQDATGGRTMTWPTSFKWPSGSPTILSTTANSVDLVVATYLSSTGFWYASLSKGFT